MKGFRHINFSPVCSVLCDAFYVTFCIEVNEKHTVVVSCFNVM